MRMPATTDGELKKIGETFEQSLSDCGNDWEKLYDLVRITIENIDDAENRKDDVLAGTFLMHYCRICENALRMLTIQDYHRFCERTTELLPLIMQYL